MRTLLETNQKYVSLLPFHRYYPQNYYQEEDQIEEEPAEVRRPPLAIQPRPQQATLRPGPQQPQFRQYTAAASNQNQVFHSPEEVNIPLQNRRPTAAPQNVQVQNSYRFQWDGLEPMSARKTLWIEDDTCIV